MLTNQPKTFDGVKAIKDPNDRLVAVVGYLGLLDAKRREAFDLRDQLIRSSKLGPTSLARLTGLSVSTIKLARRAR